MTQFVEEHEDVRGFDRSATRWRSPQKRQANPSARERRDAELVPRTTIPDTTAERPRELVDRDPSADRPNRPRAGGRS